jgi:hypothetical protein
MPNVGPDFKPYSSNGHWVYTDEGWTWASDYPWGWATFHYGRWFFEDGYGWMWIPGHEWAPAWVSWRRSPDYYGWAPLGPGVSISVSVGGGYNPPAHYWSFVPHQYINHPNVNNYYVSESRNVTIINNTTIINNRVTNTNVTNNTTINNNTTVNNHINNTVVHNNYAGGPDTHEVETYTGAPVRAVVIRVSNTPGEQAQNGSLSVYRPRANADAPAANAGGTPPKPAPPKVQQLSQVRPVNTVRYNNTTNTAPPVNNNRPVGTTPVTAAPAAVTPRAAPPPVNNAPVRPVNQPHTANTNVPAAPNSTMSPGMNAHKLSTPNTPPATNNVNNNNAAVKQPPAPAAKPAAPPKKPVKKPKDKPKPDHKKDDNQ